ncbi:DUF3667 domain-containing protein [Rhodocytophaga rosea]|uniref:DUF3667 domain-containing protein n=1 Tax=Rhodocytophaga rosea TaxID=2704465 RepID=A0A6C0GQ30_9BACT|nr:DUF3667 domain-containing protein [Rhodocytophaga rosea]QHT70037.1 DUF3667 domain-containing protein [Rhodocytophaga rosea]
MLLARRKKSNCQNCHYPLLENYSYCPNCGQENSDKLVSFTTLAAEVVNNYIAYDSRLGRTIIPFLFKPGLLTNEFIAGKRIKYMHPLRLYFIVSFFYFLIFSIVVSSQINVNEPAFRFGGDVKVPSADSLNREIGNEISTGLLESEALSGEEKHIADSIVKNLPKSQVVVPEKTDTGAVIRSGEKDVNLDKLVKTPGITPEQILDSLDQEKSWLNLLLAKQGIKLANEKGNTIVNYLISKASLMMFLLLPFFALILKLFYIRTKRLYIEHIIFTLHIHTFLFFILSVALLIDYFWPNGLIFTLSGILVFVYFLLSFRSVYHQGWFKTLLKMFILFISYAFSFSVFMVITIILSLLLF